MELFALCLVGFFAGGLSLLINWVSRLLEEKGDVAGAQELSLWSLGFTLEALLIAGFVVWVSWF
jgi:hypothetical protein